MAEPRDRLIREDPITPMLMMSGRRSNGVIWQDFGSETMGSSSSSRFSLVGGRNLFGSPIPRSREVSVSPSQGIWMRRNGSSYGTPSRINSRTGGSDELGRNLYRTTPSGGRSSGSRSRNNTTLPSWYPRTPLRDITAIVNAIERRRAQTREAERHRLGNTTGAPLEPEVFPTTPNLNAGINDHQTPIHHQTKKFIATEESDFMTPQKKLLNSLDLVEKVVREEFERMKRTPSAKKAERAKKVRTLMAMR